jgi:hypothetical protein
LYFVQLRIYIFAFILRALSVFVHHFITDDSIVTVKLMSQLKVKGKNYVWI